MRLPRRCTLPRLLLLAILLLAAVFFLNFWFLHKNVGTGPEAPALRGVLAGPANFVTLDAIASLHAGVWERHPGGLGYVFNGVPPVSHAASLACLSGKHVLLVGDSITRYTFLSLVHFLHTGRWAPRLTGDPIRPSVLFEGEFKSWYELFKAFEAEMGGSVRCQCYRDRADKRGFYENRFYHNAAHGFNVTFMGFFNSSSGLLPLGWAPHTSLSPQTFVLEQPAWTGGLDTLAGVLQQQFPDGFDDIMINSGLWKVPDMSSDVARVRTQLQQFPSLMKDKGKRPVWATTSQTRDLLPQPAGYRGPAFHWAASKGWRILDRFGLTDDLHKTLVRREEPLAVGWVDGLHFAPYVYEELNRVLLSILCPTPK